MSDNINPNTIKFWPSDPFILFTDISFFPTANMSKAEKFNALTRLAIVISIVLYAMDYPHWLTFLLISVLSIIIMYYAFSTKTETEQKENFTMTPTFINDDFQQTVVAPLFAEEQRVPPPAYDMYSNPGIADIAFIESAIERPQVYPYGQYLTRTNFLPADEYLLSVNPTGGARTARSFANNLITRNEMAHRENQTRVYKKLLERRFRMNSVTGDTFSPFTSY